MISLVFTSSNSITFHKISNAAIGFYLRVIFEMLKHQQKSMTEGMAEESSFWAFGFKNVHNFLKKPSISLLGKTKLQKLKSPLPGGSGCLLLNFNSDHFLSSIIHSQDRSVSYWKFCVTTQIPRFWAFEGW